MQICLWAQTRTQTARLLFLSIDSSAMLYQHECLVQPHRVKPPISGHCIWSMFAKTPFRHHDKRLIQYSKETIHRDGDRGLYPKFSESTMNYKHRPGITQCPDIWGGGARLGNACIRRIRNVLEGRIDSNTRSQGLKRVQRGALGATTHATFLHTTWGTIYFPSNWSQGEGSTASRSSALSDGVLTRRPRKSASFRGHI